MERHFYGLHESSLRHVRRSKDKCHDSRGKTDQFSMEIGLHQGSTLSLFRFALVFDEVTKDIEREIPKCMLFADDVVLIEESKKGLNDKLEN